MAWTVIAATAKASADGEDVTTDAIDTTGADLLIMVQIGSTNAAYPYPTDSEVNTWNGNAAIRQTGGVLDQPSLYNAHWQGSVEFNQPDGDFYCQQCIIWFCRNPTTSATHTFTSDTTDQFPLRPCLLVLALSGVDQELPITGRMSPVSYDTSYDPTPDRAFDHNSGTLDTSFDTPSFLPQEDNCIAISIMANRTHRTSTLAIDDGFTIAAQVAPVTSPSELSYGGGIAYKIQTTAAAFAPTWSWTGADHVVVFNIAFMGDGIPAGEGGSGGGPGLPGEALSRQRAWTFTHDGHTFYVLDLGSEGNWLYDVTTGQWSEFITSGYQNWDMTAGVMWDKRIVAGDRTTNDVWECSAAAAQDNDALEVSHTATGVIPHRSRNKLTVGALRASVSPGQLTSETTAPVSLLFSDDGGNTWAGPFSVTLTEGVYDAEVAFRALGSFAAPGRIFRLSDIGGPKRIDGCDVEIPEIDNAR